MAVFQSSPWHEGEKAIHRRTHVHYDEDNPTSPFLTPRAAYQIQRYQLMAIGALDDNDRPWCTVWGTGEPPLAQPIGKSIIGIRSKVDAIFDPVVKAIWSDNKDGEVLQYEADGGKMMAGLSIQLEERGRVKLAGKIVAGALTGTTTDEATDKRQTSPTDQSAANGRPGEVQMVVKIEQSLGNCPKYLNRKRISSATPKPQLLSSSPHLTQKAIDLIHQADLFFIASSHAHEDMDVNHRGGPQGFIRVQQPEDPSEGTTLVWPEYSGNNLYQTLGNLETTPRAGLVIPDFTTGNVLYVTGDTETLVGTDASNVLAKTKLAVRLKVTEARLVQTGLPFRGSLIEDTSQGRSPYNPRVRYLTTEKPDSWSQSSTSSTTAQLISKTKLTPTITRYRFALADPTIHGPWKPGQYVALDFSAELDMGYSHMRDDDPTSLNDDFIRSFTVSSPPNSLGVHGEEFEITVRNVGTVTRWLEWQRPGMCEVGVRGFAGEFAFDFGQNDDSDSNHNRHHNDEDHNQTTTMIGFIAAGIGITPLLGQLGDNNQNRLNLSRLKVWWSVGIRDIGLPLDVLTRYRELKTSMTIFLTGDETSLADKDKHKLQQLVDTGVKIERRRLQKSDLVAEGADADADAQAAAKITKWYLCTAPALRKVVQDWMPGKAIIYENFDY
ncbi:hypothetical protein HRR83_009139 [Exophiala dermatitidis]|uniref:FAD-binding FR-type domain-containing protein n=2 Tax=Exophiala dermatitidis TaxID=5970 RepID=H6CAL3_EXODN|nr:uncharacterized protein HMPREF1120_08147 [Exophiala dermatitidis NIH/UT8656]KAJ4502831.1 hypothetical protein HRR75_008296 [Exophiala dermatitidis]EHY60177.1 hypothetical protein HMPREF1120_08147 [Exophiala dermatitidis NIH/UT8656]KAJ4504384.1 hypothetical protein HRR74_009030 [Exophiala dermatitidis]KAJ4504846.1 hypothetical protein HRR73_008600 [Exophiala dermatitidis]KAJ4530737.1 hypothetical protein HRR76_008435 [Exophiala dermatitidis]